MVKRGTWAEINLNNIKDNLYALKSNLEDTTRICCVVKADAYGHGAVQVSKMLEKEKIDYLSVARFEEAIELRNAGIRMPILCMGYVGIEDIEKALLNNITLTVYSYEMAKLISEKANELDIIAKIHIKIDTGMNRIGFLVNDESIRDIENMYKFKNIYIEGIYTHFAMADELDKKDTYSQVSKFKYVVENLERLGIDIDIKHVSNSAATIDLKELGFNMVRLGIALYGYYPSTEVSKEIVLKPAIKLKTKITNIKNVKAGAKISYGYTYEFKEDSKVATLAIGYADGFDRTQKNPKVKVNGVLCDVVGRVCMDQCMIKIPDYLDVKIEDEVNIISDEDGIRVEDLAQKSGTINYEILCMISRRVSRHYYVGDRLIRIVSYMDVY